MNVKKTLICIVIIAVLSIVVYSLLSYKEKQKENTPTLGKKIQQKAINIQGDTVTLVDQPSYFISYSLKQSYFDILLTPDSDANAQQARESAENALLKTLEITKEEACSLNVNLTVAQSYSLELSGLNYGLSFCKNSKQFSNVK